VYRRRGLADSGRGGIFRRHGENCRDIRIGCRGGGARRQRWGGCGGTMCCRHGAGSAGGF